jgi:hypothetical protein
MSIPHAMDVRNIPGCTYCHPQIASVGLTEAKAKEAGYEVKVGTFPFIGNGKAIALGEAEGFIKTVFDAKTGELLGAHMIGAEVTEMIQGYHHRQDAGDHRGGTDAHVSQPSRIRPFRNRCTKACLPPMAVRSISDVALALIGMIGISRVWLGVHWPSDVVCGWIEGAAILLLARRWQPARSPA